MLRPERARPTSGRAAVLGHLSVHASFSLPFLKKRLILMSRAFDVVEVDFLGVAWRTC